MAMKILRSKLYEIEMRQRAEKVAEAHKSKKDIAWGSQIRSYVLAPYRMMKDHRTGHEREWLQACQGGPPAWSNFSDYGAPSYNFV